MNTDRYYYYCMYLKNKYVIINFTKKAILLNINPSYTNTCTCI